ncbi:MAG TPA: NAD(P)H-binding protein [Thermoanaerobaculia bacterium]|nr:NAD(P)H-binding protein [Thermoanaerobaculia bacterium]
MSAPHRIFVAGGTGYIGGATIPLLLRRGHVVRTLARPGSEGSVPQGAETVIGNALDAGSFVSAVASCDTFLQLVGVAHPSPAKARQFREIDLASARASSEAARRAGVSHFVFLSVAQPAPAMKAYVRARADAEAFVTGLGFPATTFLRPWYVLGPGHRWPYLLLPGYRLAELLPWTREAARRLGLVTLPQMAAALVKAVENPPTGVRIVAVPEIRRAGAGAGKAWKRSWTGSATA